MNEEYKKIKAVYMTEKKFWGQIARIEISSDGSKIYKPKDNFNLREADKVVAKSPCHLNSLLFEQEPKLIRFFRDEGEFNKRLDNKDLLDVFNGIVYQPYGEATLYLWAEEIIGIEGASSTEFTLKVAEDSHDIECIRWLRDRKDKNITNKSVRESLQIWAEKRRSSEGTSGYRSLILKKTDKLVGMVSFYRDTNDEQPLTRIRDLFIDTPFRRCGCAKLLFNWIQENTNGPYAVVTDLGNTALFQYHKRGFKEIFVQEAYKAIDYDKNHG